MLLPAMAIDHDVEGRIRAACEAGAWQEATTVAMKAYGPELVGYLAALTRNASDADDLFGQVAEALWRSLPSFRWESSLQTYAYTLARHAWLRRGRESRHQAKREPLSSPAVEAVVADVRSRTATYLRTESKDKIARLRQTLDPDDQALLILRINRRMEWREIAIALSDPGEETDRAALDRRAAALRKRLERLKVQLRERLDREDD
jgi:RNA polymerase sigma-70 factor (ECF subfamily)